MKQRKKRRKKGFFSMVLHGLKCLFLGLFHFAFFLNCFFFFFLVALMNSLDKRILSLSSQKFFVSLSPTIALPFCLSSPLRKIHCQTLELLNLFSVSFKVFSRVYISLPLYYILEEFHRSTFRLTNLLGSSRSSMLVSLFIKLYMASLGAH